MHLSLARLKIGLWAMGHGRWVVEDGTRAGAWWAGRGEEGRAGSGLDHHGHAQSHKGQQGAATQGGDTPAGAWVRPHALPCPAHVCLLLIRHL
jgi:hypothetical protein